jgi:hypothetical protein
MHLQDFDAAPLRFQAISYFLSFFATFSYSSVSHPATIPSKSKLSPSPFPAGKARDAQGEHF